MQTFGKLSHERELLLARAVTGIIFRVISIELFGIGFKPLRTVQLHKMKTADQVIGTEPFDDIQNSLVGASAEQHAPALLLNQQILLVPKILGDKTPVTHRIQIGRSEIKTPFSLVAGIKRHSVTERILLVGEPQPFAAFDGGIESDILLRSVVVRLKGVSAQALM